MNTKEHYHTLQSYNLSPVAHYINDIFDGDILLFTQWLDKAIYLLHYLPEDEPVHPIDRQNTCFALMGLKEAMLVVMENQEITKP